MSDEPKRPDALESWRPETASPRVRRITALCIEILREANRRREQEERAA